jgi:hypothetical protein
MRMHIVSTLWETSAVSVIQDSLEMDTTAQILMNVKKGHTAVTLTVLAITSWAPIYQCECLDRFFKNCNYSYTTVQIGQLHT